MSLTFCSPFTAGRYHSLVIEKESFPSEELEVTAWTEDGLIMAARHRKYKHLQVRYPIVIHLLGNCPFIQLPDRPEVLDEASIFACFDLRAAIIFSAFCLLHLKVLHIDLWLHLHKNGIRRINNSNNIFPHPLLSLWKSLVLIRAKNCSLTWNNGVSSQQELFLQHDNVLFL